MLMLVLVLNPGHGVRRILALWWTGVRQEFACPVVFQVHVTRQDDD
jgi:hypothetical protein